MTVLLIAVGSWIAVASLLTVLAVALGRAAAIGDSAPTKSLDWQRPPEVDLSVVDRRVGSEDRRAEGRPWAGTAAGRRAEDVLRQDLAEARRVIADAEARLAEIEARQTA